MKLKWQLEIIVFPTPYDSIEYINEIVLPPITFLKVNDLTSRSLQLKNDEEIFNFKSIDELNPRIAIKNVRCKRTVGRLLRSTSCCDRKEM